jgi:hypothetical protein
MSDEKNDFQKKIGVGESQYVYGRRAGSSRDIPVYREDNGKIGGKQTEHWNGSVDCTVYPETKNLILDRKTGDVVPK